jgi:hypothetical protein
MRTGDDLVFHDGATGTKTLLEIASGAGNVVLSDVTADDTTRWGTAGSGVVDTAGGQVANQFAYWTNANTLDGSTAITKSGDSIVSTNMVVSTKLRLKAFDTDATDTVALIVYKLNGKVDTATIVNAGFGLKDNGLFLKYFTKRVNGELNWPRYKGDSYHDMNAMTSGTQLQAGIERAYVWIFRMQMVMFLMFLVIVWLTVQVIKLKRK